MVDEQVPEDQRSDVKGETATNSVNELWGEINSLTLKQQVDNVVQQKNVELMSKMEKIVDNVRTLRRIHQFVAARQAEINNDLATYWFNSPYHKWIMTYVLVEPILLTLFPLLK
ncbi:putative transmembrane protein [Gregarina niphandrodes]|uniref:Transmembrane protein n=1 Tax=Gregarina niphandrodes TaxID=110365 RepID=A0A023B155_GRENI|nr:putative transmembrane protein [Gregarina niphandrodes]EZG46743.1 putative transmembrane protein [Gregarina niphandrodes]|eukprot:XP_011132252.1 putative transmembrane protein [Gregarina niphandrodes]